MIREVSADYILSQLDGETILSSHVEDENGLHINLKSGRCLVIVGDFGISIVGQDVKELH